MNKLLRSSSKTMNTLIYINLFIFIFLLITQFLLPVESFTELSHYFIASTNYADLYSRPWTLISFSFTHISIIHFIFNVGFLVSFSSVFLRYLDDEDVFNIYIMASLIPGIILILIGPLFYVETTYFTGASASLFAFMYLLYKRTPFTKVYIAFIVPVNMKYATIISLILSALMPIYGINSLGGVAHILGFLIGVYYIEYIEKNSKRPIMLNPSYFFYKNKKNNE